MSGAKYTTKIDALNRINEFAGKTFYEIDSTNRIEVGKGALGSIIEESVFGYSINSESRPDLEDAGLELKVTPFIRTPSGLRSKERLVCNIINYMTEYSNTFYTSSFWTKCKSLLLSFYEHRYDIDKKDFVLEKSIIFEYPEEDLEIIKRDWEKIVSKIKDGKAHELSEGDTLYLGACTKGATSSSVREQPFSNIMAKQRAFSLKQSYMTYILNSYVFGKDTDENVIKDTSILKKKSFEDYLIDKIKPYIGLKQGDLIKQFGLNKKSKNINELILAKVLGVNGKISNTEEFKKANIIPKTIQIQQNGLIKENMSFPTFKFTELIKEDWETSTLKSMFEQTKFLFVIFKSNELDELIFEGVKFWNMPERDLDELKIVWEKTKTVIENGVEINNVNGRNLNNLPKQSESRIAHVRPHANNSSYTYDLPDGRTMTKQCFWLNKSYIRSQLDLDSKKY